MMLHVDTPTSGPEEKDRGPKTRANGAGLEAMRLSAGRDLRPELGIQGAYRFMMLSSTYFHSVHGPIGRTSTKNEPHQTMQLYTVW